MSNRRESLSPGIVPSPAVGHLDTPRPAEPAFPHAPGGRTPSSSPDTPMARLPDHSPLAPQPCPTAGYRDRNSPMPLLPAAVVAPCLFRAFRPRPTAGLRVPTDGQRGHHG